MTESTSSPSMDDILASIRRIIAEEDAAADSTDSGEVPKPEPVSRLSVVPAATQQEPLELTDPIDRPPSRPSAAAEPLLSDSATDASRQALATLSSLIVAGGRENTLEGVVREMLRPLLKAWLDERLPAIVEAAVAREMARIAGKDL